MFFSLECQGILSKTVVESCSQEGKHHHLVEYSYDYAGTGVQLCTKSNATAAALQLLQIWQDGRKHLTRPVNCATVVNPGMLILVLVLVLKDSLRTFFKYLSLSWSLG